MKSERELDIEKEYTPPGPLGWTESVLKIGKPPKCITYTTKHSISEGKEGGWADTYVTSEYPCERKKPAMFSIIKQPEAAK